MSTPAIARCLKQDVPTPSNHAWYQSGTVRRVILCSTALLSVASFAATRWAYTKFNATPLTVLWTIRGLTALTTTLAVSTLINLFSSSSEKDPAYRKRQRKEALEVIEPADGKVMGYADIKRRFSSLFDKGILVNADVCALIRKDCEVNKLKFDKLAEKNKIEVLNRLDEPTKQLLRAKFLEDATLAGNLNQLMADGWVIKLGVKPEQLAPRLLKERATELTGLNFSLADFENQYGLDVLKFAPPNVQLCFSEKIRTRVEPLSVNDFRKHYETTVKEVYGNALFVTLLSDVISNKKMRLLAGRVESYNEFKKSNGYDTIGVIAQNPFYKSKLKELYLQMEARSLLSDDYAEDRKLLGIEIDECIAGLDALAESKPYAEFKRIAGSKYVSKLSAPTQERYRKEIWTTLVGNPKLQVQYAEEMGSFGFTNDAIYFARWKGKKFPTILAEEGPDFPALLVDPKAIKSKVLQETAGMNLSINLLVRCPVLFRTVLTPNDKAEGTDRTLQQRLESEITNYKGLQDAAKAYGDGFYTSGYLSQSHLDKIVASYLFANTNLLFDLENKIVVPMSTQLTAVWDDKRREVVQGASQYSTQIRELREISNQAKQQIRADAQASIENGAQTKTWNEAKKHLTEIEANLQETEAELAKAIQEEAALRKQVQANETEQKSVLAEIATLGQSVKVPLRQVEERLAEVKQLITKVLAEHKANQPEFNRRKDDDQELKVKNQEVGDCQRALNILVLKAEREEKLALIKRLSFTQQASDPSFDIQLATQRIKKIDEDLASKGAPTPELANLTKQELKQKQKEASEFLQQRISVHSKELTSLNDQYVKLSAEEKTLLTTKGTYDRIAELQKKGIALLEELKNMKLNEVLKRLAMLEDLKAQRTASKNVSTREEQRLKEAFQKFQQEELAEANQACEAVIQKLLSDEVAIDAWYTLQLKVLPEEFKNQLKTWTAG